ncbi:hypothetical protein EDB74_102107 [Vibrio crassostreae]|nr:hypothetical protein EDB74_102107 [Vibrio crassostreae]
MEAVLLLFLFQITQLFKSQVNMAIPLLPIGC